MASNNLIRLAIRYWANWIETGDCATPASEAEKYGIVKKQLDAQQRAVVARLRKLDKKWQQLEKHNIGLMEGKI